MIILIHVELRLKSQSFFKGSEFSSSELSRSEFSRHPFWLVSFGLVSQTTGTPVGLVSQTSGTLVGFVSFRFVSQTTVRLTCVIDPKELKTEKRFFPCFNLFSYFC